MIFFFDFGSTGTIMLPLSSRFSLPKMSISLKSRLSNSAGFIVAVKEPSSALASSASAVIIALILILSVLSRALAGDATFSDLSDLTDLLGVAFLTERFGVSVPFLLERRGVALEAPDTTVLSLFNCFLLRLVWLLGEVISGAVDGLIRTTFY